MATEGDVNSTSTTNIHMDGGKKNRKGKKHQKGNEEVFLNLVPSETLTSRSPSTVEARDDELGEDAIDVNFREEWVAKMELATQAVEILGRRVNVADDSSRPLRTSPFRRTSTSIRSWRVANGTSLR